MGTRQGNRLVSPNAANGPLLLSLGHPGDRSAKPCARDPPRVMSPMAATQLYRDGLRRARHSRDPLGEDLPRARPQTERGDAVNIASSQRRTRKS